MTNWKDLLHPGDASDFFARRPMPPFNPATLSYSRANARWLAELSRLAYRHDHEEADHPPQPTQTRFLEKAGCTHRQFFFSRDTDTQALLVQFDHAIPFAVLVFRGTEQHVQDYVTDLNLGKLRQSDGKVDTHRGFTRALDSVWEEIEQALKRLDRPVFYTGHSLGAALATLATARLRPAALYTFGSPRVGDDDFARQLADFEARIHRLVHGDDLVTKVPPEDLGFRHVGREVKLESPPARNWLQKIADWFRPPKALADHAPVNYVDKA